MSCSGVGFGTSTLEANATGAVVFEGGKGNYEEGYFRSDTVFASNYTNGVGVVNSTTVRLHAGQPWTAFSASLGYYDSYRSAVLPANLLQAQRDFFGAHTYERTDKPRGEMFHTDWPEVIG